MFVVAGRCGGSMRDMLAPKEWYRVNRFVKGLERASPPVVSVYVPSSGVEAMLETLRTTDRGEEVEPVEQRLEEEVLAHSPFSGSLAAFGWAPEVGRVEVDVLLLDAELPPIYVVGETPFVEPLHDILEIRYDLILVVLDQSQATLYRYLGSECLDAHRVRSWVHSKHRKGGWSQKRFARLRELQVKHHFDRVEEKLRQLGVEDVSLVILTGPGNAKKRFFQRPTLENIRDKLSVVEGIDFNSSESEIMKTISEQLNNYRKKVEARKISYFREKIKDNLVLWDNNQIEKFLAQGAVEMLLIASDYHAATPEEDEKMLRIIEKAEKTSVDIEFITKPETLEELHKHGSAIATLRYR